MVSSFNNAHLNIKKKCLQKENRIDMNPNIEEGTELSNELYLQFQKEINIFINCINGHEIKDKEKNYVDTSHVMVGSEDEFIFYLRNIQDNQKRENKIKEKQLQNYNINWNEYSKNYKRTPNKWNECDIEKKQKKKKINYSSNSICKNNEKIIFENMLNKNEKILNNKISEIIEFGKKRNDPNIYKCVDRSNYTYLKNYNLKGYKNGFMNISNNYNELNNINIYNCDEEDDIWNTFMFTRNDSKDSKMIIDNFVNKIKDSNQKQNNDDITLKDITFKKYTHKKKKKKSYQRINNNYTQHLNFKNINMQNEQKTYLSTYNNESNVFREYEKIVKKNEKILILLYKIIYKLNIFDINKKFNKKIEDVVNIYIIKVNNIISTYKLLLQYDNIQSRKMLEYYLKKNEIILLKNILKYIIQLMSEIKRQYSGIKKQIQKKIMEIQKVAS
ncbi:conserved Plasmodium protein, unknown function [Plasmodium gaboni]|uniref:Uncharacterized protein n=1 Tax=Plasmodium gaboni TaxID=647221 RepID=A0ABY1UR15_9APIC|nr:conserved Plasmodium protein, unknown function [Plasmodium gaboni]